MNGGETMAKKTKLSEQTSDRLYEMNIAASIADRKFIRDRIAAEYLGRYYELVG